MVEEPSATLVDYLENTIDIENAYTVAQEFCAILQNDDILEEDKAEMIANRLKAEAPGRFRVGTCTDDR